MNVFYVTVSWMGQMPPLHGKEVSTAHTSLVDQGSNPHLTSTAGMKITALKWQYIYKSMTV